MDAEPIAWAVFSEQGREAVYAADLRANAERACLLNGWRLVPIYDKSRPIPAGSPPCRNGRSMAMVPRRNAARQRLGDEGAGITWPSGGAAPAR